MLPVLRLAAKGETRIGAAAELLAAELGLNDEEINRLLPSGKQTVIRNRVHWAKFYLSKARLLETTKRGHFKITDRGLSVLGQSPSLIDKNFLTQFSEFNQFLAASAAKDDSDDLPNSAGTESTQNEKTPDETMRNAHRQIEDALAQELLERVVAAKPAFFEQTIVRLLLAMGYGGTRTDAGRALGQSGDDGVDGVIDQDALGLDRVYVQAKRHAANQPVGPAAIREFFGSLDMKKATKGIFFTTSSFTPSASSTANALGKRIVLIDGPTFASLMVRYNVGCRIEDTLALRRVDEEFFVEE